MGKWYNAEGTTTPAKQYWFFFFPKTMGLLCEKVLVWPHYSEDTGVGSKFDTDFRQFFLFFLFPLPKIFTSAQLSSWNKEGNTYRESCIKSSLVLQKSMEWHPVFTGDVLSRAMIEDLLLPGRKIAGVPACLLTKSQKKNQHAHSNDIQTHAHITLGTSSCSGKLACSGDDFSSSATPCGYWDNISGI